MLALAPLAPEPMTRTSAALARAASPLLALQEVEPGSVGARRVPGRYEMAPSVARQVGRGMEPADGVAPGERDRMVGEAHRADRVVHGRALVIGQVDDVAHVEAIVGQLALGPGEHRPA